MADKTESRIRSTVRAMVGAPRRNHIPVVVLDDAPDKPPELTGKRGGFFTRGGTRIYHPCAYARRGWSNMVYCRSSELITIGRSVFESLGNPAPN